MDLEKYREPENFWERILFFYEKNAKKLGILLKCTAFIVVLMIMVKLLHTGYQRYVFVSNLKRTTVQIAQLVDNVRTVYVAVDYAENIDIMQALLNTNSIPDFLVKDGELHNVYGGKVKIIPSISIKDKATGKSLPTFKISYQGLSKDTCTALAQINWGDNAAGLVAAAVGFVDAYGADTALRDIDIDTNSGFKEVIAENGKIRKIKTPAHTLSTVAKPNDAFNPLPFSELLANSGCNCEKRLQCSFALRYYALQQEYMVQ